MGYPNMMISETKTRVSTVTSSNSIKLSLSVEDWKWFLDQLRKIPPGKDFIINTKEGDRDVEIRFCNRDSGMRSL